MIENVVTGSDEEGLSGSSSTGFGNNQFDNNNGGNAFAQTIGGSIERIFSVSA